MLRKTLIGISFSAFVGICAISLSDHTAPQLEVFRASLFKSQRLMFKAICLGGSNLADRFTGVLWRHVPCSWSFIHGKIRVEILRPAACSIPGHSLSVVEPCAAEEEDSQVRIVLDPS
jgi:hypothetical protein